ncbi:MAG TPA: mannonate dehydratase, partial [Bacteroidales bacterium]|nr:mannonate dehydratase [Bacteroidales bacterium]
MIKLKKTWRWFGPGDPVTLQHLRQMDVEGVVTALHDVPAGEVWTNERVSAVKKQVERAGLQWSVVESLPVPEGIKRHDRDYGRLTENYRLSLKTLGEQGINIVCYNFMPAIDWIRTDIDYMLPNGTAVMFFGKLKFMAFDLFILERPGAAGDYSDEEKELARRFYDGMSKKESEELAYNIIVRTQAFIHGEDHAANPAGYKESFLKKLRNYKETDSQRLRENLLTFLADVLPVAEEYGINLCIHPDDPPFPLLGLPRIVSTFNDLEKIFSTVPSLNNGLTFCSGSLSIRKENDL